MIRPQEIVCYKLSDHVEWHIIDGARKDPDKPFLWLQRLLYKALLKLGQPAMEPTIKHERHLIDGDDFGAAVFKGVENVHEYLNRSPCKIYMGPDEFNELANPKTSGRFGFDFQMTLVRDRTVFNVPVQVVPYMKGFLVV